MAAKERICDDRRQTTCWTVEKNMSTWVLISTADVWLHWTTPVVGGRKEIIEIGGGGGRERKKT
jgi:hypothetical protein